MQWKSDAVLGMLARAKVAEQADDQDQTTMAKWAQAAVGNCTLCDLLIEWDWHSCCR